MCAVSVYGQTLHPNVHTWYTLQYAAGDSTVPVGSFVMQDGVFHHNTLLTLNLASPYFSSGRKDERFTVVVMEHKEDGHIR